MRLLIVLLPFGTLLHQSLIQGKEPKTSGLSKAAQKEIVDKFNDFRRNVNPTASNMLKMVWDENASKSAQKRTAKCQPNNDYLPDRLVDGVFCGESLSQSSYVRSWSEIIDQWHSSVSNFKYGVGTIDPQKPAHGYTQVVWYKSSRIGCSLAYCPKNNHTFFYACRFCPVGNVLENLAVPYKKGPSCGDCPNNCEDKLCTNPCNFQDIISDCKKLVGHIGCNHTRVQKYCKATCTCKTEIM